MAFALIGIVTLQLGLLKLNAGIGRALEHEALLQRENAALSIENSELAAGDRVQSLAARLGMELVPPGSAAFPDAPAPDRRARAAAAALSTPAHAHAGRLAERALLEAARGSAHARRRRARPPATGEAPAAAAHIAVRAASPRRQAPAIGARHRPRSRRRTSRHARRRSEAGPPNRAASVRARPRRPRRAPAGGGSAEATPAGGTQAGSAG